MKDSKSPIYYYCAFCGLSSSEVKTIIAGKYANICNECVVSCLDILIRRNDEQENKDGGHEPG